MTERRRLPNRRFAETFQFTHRDNCNIVYYATIGRYPDGTVGEIFLSCNKTTTETDALAKDAALLASLAMQHGCSRATIRAALTQSADGRPMSALGTALDMVDEAE